LQKPATLCFLSLIFNGFPLTINEDDDESHKVVTEYARNNPSLEYAAMNWMEHLEKAELDNNPKWMPSILSLCTVNERVFRTWYTIYQRVRQNHIPRKMTSLNIAADNSPNVLASLLESGETQTSLMATGQRRLRAPYANPKQPWAFFQMSTQTSMPTDGRSPSTISSTTQAAKLKSSRLQVPLWSWQ
jgi:hypothetical protein